MLKTGCFISVRCIQALARLMVVSATVWSLGAALRAADRPAIQAGQEKTTDSQGTGLTAGARRPGTTHDAAAKPASRKSVARSKTAEPRPPAPGTDQLAALKAQLAVQQQQITELRSSLAEQKQLLERALENAQARRSEAPARAEVASLEPVTAGSAT